MSARRSPTRLLVAAILLVLGLGGGPDTPAQPRLLKRVRIAVGTTNLNVGYPWLTLPLSLDYWKQEGYDVEVLPVGASLQALQQMVAGNAELAQLNSSVVIQANVVNQIPVRVVMNTGVIDWSDARVGDPWHATGVEGRVAGAPLFSTTVRRFYRSEPVRDKQARVISSAVTRA